MVKAWRLRVEITKIYTCEVRGDQLVPVETAADAIRIAGLTRLDEIVAPAEWICEPIEPIAQSEEG